MNVAPNPDSNTVYRIIDSTGSGSIVSGTFTFNGNPLNDGDTFSVGATRFQIAYNPLGASGDVTLTEAAPEEVNLSVSANTGTESGQTQITVTATASAAVIGNQTVNVAVSGTGVTAGDYILSNTQITILDGQAQGSVTFTVRDDVLIEGEETVTLTITDPTSGLVLGTAISQDIVITDNDLPGNTAASVLAAAPNGMTDIINVTVSGGVLNVDVDGSSSGFGDPSSVTSLTINGVVGENDVVNIDFGSNADLFQIGTLFLNLGGDANDDLNITVAGNAVTLDFDAIGSGSVAIGSTMIMFTGVGTNTVTITGSNDLTIDLPTGPTTDAIITNNAGMAGFRRARAL